MKQNLHLVIAFGLLAALAFGCHPKPQSSPAQPPVAETPKPADTPTPQPAAEGKPSVEQMPSSPSPTETVEKLIAQYERGEVERCIFQGQPVIKCCRNAPDAGCEVFNLKGERIGRCYPSTGTQDAVCTELTKCYTLYRCSPNIWGKPGVPYAKPD